MKQTFFLNCECFVFEHKGIHTAYFPERSLAFAVNQKGALLLAKLKEGLPANALPPEEKHFINNLKKLRLLRRNEKGSTKRQRQNPGLFLPTALTLLLTTDCNLRCIYCYSEGGERISKTAPEGAIKRAVDRVVNNASATRTDTVYLTIHGGGEPTCAWKAMTAAVDYFQNTAASAKLRHITDISTNGVLTNAQREWIVKNIQSIQVSLDGPEQIQNQQRPKAGGSGSYADVMETIQYFEKNNVRFCIRSTVDQISPAEMESFVAELSRFSCCTSIHFEPLFFCGRCATSGVTPPAAKSFMEAYRAALKKGEETGIRVWYSGVNAERFVTKYCGVSTPNFCITPEGHVTACYEVSSLDDPRASSFIFGRYDEDKKDFLLNEAMIEELQKRDVKNIPFCANCFCKYHCAADCAAKAHSLDGINNYRCLVNRELTMDQIVSPLANALSEISG
jgi:uncharacterized protein